MLRFLFIGFPGENRGLVLGSRSRYRLSPTACVLVGWLMLLSPSARAHERRLTLSPARLPVPVLRYPLLPELRDQIPGNAALVYRKAVRLELRPDPRLVRMSAQCESWLQI